ncbi:MAG: DUF4157 domain-containing protein [Microbacterium sp.]
MTAARALSPVTDSTSQTAPVPQRVPHGPLPLGRADAGAEREAGATARMRVPAWSFGSVPLTADAGMDMLDVRLDDGGMPAAGVLADSPDVRASMDAQDLGAARIHTGPAAADTARRAGADAVTVGSHIAFAAGAFAPSTTRGRGLIAHELAHVAQARGAASVVRRDPTAEPAPATTLMGLPEADRKRIQVVTDLTYRAPALDKSFSENAKPLALPAGTTVAVDASASGVQAGGLHNVAAQLVLGKPAALPPNNTLTLKLDLSPYGGIDGLYRFTRHVPPAAKGRAASARILVEQLGAATAPAGQAVPGAPEPGKTAPPDPIAAKMSAASLTHSLTGTQLEALRGAISQIPASHLAFVSGLKVIAGAPPGGRDGYYDSKKNVVTVRTGVFGASDVHFSGNGVATSYASQVIIHEIGHAIDMATLRGAESGSKGKDYKAAAKKDGGIAVSSYGASEWQENYAEAYGLFISSPETLKALRPETYAYLEKSFAEKAEKEAKP